MYKHFQCICILMLLWLLLRYALRTYSYIFCVIYLNLWLSNEDDYLLKWRQTSCICIFNSNCFLPASLHNYIFAWRSILWFYRESLRTNFCGFNIIIAQNQNVDRRKPFIIQNTLSFFKSCKIIIACVKYFT